MKRRSVKWFAMITLFLSGLTYAQELQTVDHVDLERYMGKWYEIARFPFKQQEGCFNTFATYSLQENSVKVLNRCLKGGFDGKESIANGKAVVVDKNSNAKLKVSFIPFHPPWIGWGNYWVIELGEEYEFAVVSEPRRKYLWILSRTQKMDSAVYQELISRLEHKGFDTSRLIKTPQQTEIASKGRWLFEEDEGYEQN